MPCAGPGFSRGGGTAAYPLLPPPKAGGEGVDARVAARDPRQTGGLSETRPRLLPPPFLTNRQSPACPGEALGEAGSRLFPP